MKNHINKPVLSGCIFLLLTVVFMYSEAYTQTYTGTPRTIAHDFLDIEKQFGTDNRHYEYMNSLINKARAIIKVKNDYTTEEAVRILTSIHLLLKKEGFVFKQNFLLNTGIDRKEIDCDNYSALYIAISEVLMLPVIPVCAPNHSFVRFNFNDGSYLNWDTVDAKPYPDEYYIKNLKISENSLRKGVYLKNLTRKEFIGLEYSNIGSYLFAYRNFQESIPFFNAAIRHYANYSSAYHNRGSAYYALNRPDRALADLLAANSLDPGQASTHNTLGDIYLDRKEYMNAFDHYAESIKLDPGNYAPYHGLGLIMKNTGKNKEAHEWFKKSEEIKKKHRK